MTYTKTAIALLMLIFAVAMAYIGLSAAASAPAYAASGEHWCRQGDPPILASKHTSCGLAGNIVTRWVNLNGPLEDPFTVKSPVTKKSYSIRCTLKEYGGTARCKGANGIKISFSSDI